MAKGRRSDLFRYPPRPSPADLLATHPDLDARFIAPYEVAVPYTMTSPERMYALWQAVRHVLARRLPGALVECGVWRGGSSMLMAQALLVAGQADRELWLYDTFAGMPAASPGDVDFTGVPASERLEQAAGDRDDLVVAYASLVEIRANMERTGYPSERIYCVAGLVEDTIPAQTPLEIALLRLDTDWESSTRHELAHLWPRLVPGGVLIVDDYGHWSGARRAVDSFFAERDDAPLLVRVDYSGRVGVKPGG